MKKITIAALIVVAVLFCESAGASIFPLFGKNEEDERVTALLNQIQFTTCKIINSKDKGLLESEFDDILNNIEPSSLKDDDIISEYGYLLNTLTALKLTQNQKEHIEEMAKLKRKNAIFNSFNSFGSVLYVPSKDPVSIGIALAYAALNAGFNYARTVNEIKMNEKDEEFDIQQTELQMIDQQRASLFTTCAKIYGRSKYSSSGLIGEAEMKDLAKIAFAMEKATDEERKSVAQRNLPTLEKMKDNFSAFIPYWSVLGETYMALGDNKNAKATFKKVEELSEKSQVFKINPYLRDGSRQMIAILLSEKAGKSELKKQIALLEKNTLKTQVMQDDLNYFLYSTYIAMKDYGAAEKCLDYLTRRDLEHEIEPFSCTFALLTEKADSEKYRKSEAMMAWHASVFSDDGKAVCIKCPFEVTYAYSFTEGFFFDKEQELEIERISDDGDYKAFKFPQLKWKTLKKTQLLLVGDKFCYIIDFGDASDHIIGIGIRNSRKLYNPGEYDIYYIDGDTNTFVKWEE